MERSPNYLAAIARTGYAGPLSLEIFNDRFREWSASRIAHDGFRALTVLLDQVGLHEPLAPAAPILGVDFIELAASPEEAAELAPMLCSLGFIPQAEHRSKDVSLWRQGDLHLVINRDADGWAHAHWQIHGFSVCALALKVADPAGVLKRAAALNIETFRQRVAAGELAIPWIRGVGGALTYFTEPDQGQGHWTNDFIRTGLPSKNTSASLDISELDHVSQAMRAEELLSWQLHYTALSDVVKQPIAEISDTQGLVQTQIIESANGAFRAILNASSANQTLAARFVGGGMGAGVQHIALRTGDIFLAARRAAENGLEVLPVSGNYYEDLRARFGLASELIAQLQAAYIFYDRDGQAEYFHFYSRAFKKRLFFEIVERRGGYTGYGINNSAARLAAQARYKWTRFD